MNLLTEQQRKNALICLAKAPDEVILSAMVDYKAHMHRMEGVKRNFDATLTELNQTQFDERRQSDEPVSEDKRGSGIIVRENVNPGASSIGKIGGKAKEDILEHLCGGVQPPRSYAEHLKLLWARGEVKFDGQVFYL